MTQLTLLGFSSWNTHISLVMLNFYERYSTKEQEYKRVITLLTQGPMQNDV